MDDPARLRAWSYRRQGLDGIAGDARAAHGASDALSALKDVVAVYSSHPTAPLALHARVGGFTAADFAELERERRAVRIVAMRESGFLAPLETADILVAATRKDVQRRIGLLRARGLDPATYASLKPRVLDALREPMAPAQLDRALGVDHGDRTAYFTMRVMARESLVLRVGFGRVRTDDLRWVATDAWLGRSLGDVDPAVALAGLAAFYLHGYGPARVRDFAWWAGVALGRARAAVAAVPTEEIAPGLLLAAGDRTAWDAGIDLDPDAVAVLPKWDPYTMGYAPDGRGRLVEDGHLPLAYSTAETRIGATSGDGLPLILVGGRAVATWSHRLAGPSMRVTLTPFEAVGSAGAALLERARPQFARVGEFLGAAVEIELGRG